VLGYREIQFHPPAFEKDLQWDEAVDLIPRLEKLAQSRGKGFSVKFSNTLVVKNHKQVFQDELMYLSGPPLHVIAMQLAERFRDHVKDSIPMSFSGGMDAHNFAGVVAKGFVPATTCTDLLRPGGYGRLIRYLENLGSEMRALGVTNIPDFVRRYRGTGSYERYTWERNKGTPRKIGSKLWLYDCINCDKCVPVCPNDANFVYETQAQTIEYDNFELLPGRIRCVPGGVLRVVKQHQLANYADACNDCGNCDVFCPEDGGPNVEKPRFFGSLETYRRHAGDNAFFVDWDCRTIYGVIAGHRYTLTLDKDTARYTTESAEVEVRTTNGQVLTSLVGQALPPVSPACGRIFLDMLPYLKLKLLLESAGDPRHVHFANVANLEETIHDHPVTH